MKVKKEIDEWGQYFYCVVIVLLLIIVTRKGDVCMNLLLTCLHSLDIS